MPAHLPKPNLSRPRPEIEMREGGGGEGGNRARTDGPSRLATLIGSNGILAAALLVSAVLVAVTAAALNPQ